MANTYFFLKDKNSTKKQSIILGFNCSDGKIKIYLPITKIIPKYWDGKKSRVKNVVEVQNKDLVNSYLSEIEVFLNANVELMLLSKQLITKEKVKLLIDKYIRPEQKKETISFIDFIKKYISDCKAGIRLNEGKKMAALTIKSYTSGQNGLIDYEIYLGHKIEWKNINVDFWYTFTQYLTIEKKYKINTVGSYQKKLMLFLKEARRFKLFNDPFIDDVKILKEDADDVYLSEKELLLIENLDLSKNESLSRVRDLFLKGCNTGFRISDWHQIKAENIKVTEKGNEYLEIIQTKTGKIATTPLRPIVKALIAKYDNSNFKISDQKFNDYVKKLCEKAKINEAVTISATVAGKKETKIFEKWEQVTSHTARRSFATNMARNGVDTRIIMKAIGLTTEKSFLRYLKLDNQDFMDMLAEHNAK